MLLKEIKFNVRKIKKRKLGFLRVKKKGKGERRN